MKKAILAVSFGTTYKTALEQSIRALENDFKSAFSDYDVFGSFTSEKIIRSLKSRGLEIDNVTSALKKLCDSGYDEVVIQPTHLIAGEEYEKLCKSAEVYRNRFSVFKIGIPLLWNREDLKRVCIFFNFKFCTDDSALVLMGHGTEHHINTVYGEMNDVCAELGYDRIFIGTVESYPGINDIINQLRKNRCKNAVLTPLMLVAGDHAHNDMTGDSSECWKSRLEAENIIIEAVIRGMGEYPEIRRLYIEHLSSTIKGD